MVRLIVFFAAVALIAYGMSWLADNPGRITVEWQDREISLSVMHAVIGLATVIGAALVGWSVIRQLLASPGHVLGLLRRRKQTQGLDALSTGIIAVGAGDRELATRFANQARRSLPHEPLTDLLRAQAAQLAGDTVTAHRIYEAMLSSPDTELLGLRGLFLEAQTQQANEAARQFAERAMRINPKIDWPVSALFDIQCRDGNWEGALETLGVAKRNGHVEKAEFSRRRAVLLTAQAQALEEEDIEEAMALAQEAHRLAPDLVPAAEIAGRLLASRGNTSKAASVLMKTWKMAPHPNLASAYSFARPGDSPKDRLKRVKDLAATKPHDAEAPIAVATAAIEARDWDTARHALQPMLDRRLTQRVCTLMARIEGGEHGDRGRVREWLARAVNAPRDPAWTADGMVSEHWQPVSPVTGKLDAFEWKVPAEAMDKSRQALRLEEFVPLVAAAEGFLPENGVGRPEHGSNGAAGSGAESAKPVEAIEVTPEASEGGADTEKTDVVVAETASDKGEASSAAGSKA